MKAQYGGLYRQSLGNEVAAIEEIKKKNYDRTFGQVKVWEVASEH
jgi:hypothetical protein